MVRCVVCEGEGCGACEDGNMVIDSCPSRMAGAEAYEAIRLARFAKRGAWPVAGGTLDQTRSCLDVFGFVWSEQEERESAHRAKAGLPASGD